VQLRGFPALQPESGGLTRAAYRHFWHTAQECTSWRSPLPPIRVQDDLPEDWLATHYACMRDGRSSLCPVSVGANLDLPVLYACLEPGLRIRGRTIHDASIF
jgi:hypothetical protein